MINDIAQDAQQRMEKSVNALVENFKKLNQGTSINGIIRSDLIQWIISLPSVPELKIIAKKLSSIDDTIQNATEELCKYKVLKKGLMQDLLTGKVRVKPDEPEDTAQ